MNAHLRFLRDSDGQATVGLQFIVQMLGRSRDYSPPRQVRLVAALVAECGFPPPWPQLVGGRKGAPDRVEHAVTRSSRWSRAAVEAWLEDFLPPGNAAALDARAQAEAAGEMDAAAADLRLVS